MPRVHFGERAACGRAGRLKAIVSGKAIVGEQPANGLGHRLRLETAANAAHVSGAGGARLRSTASSLPVDAAHVVSGLIGDAANAARRQQRPWPSSPAKGAGQQARYLIVSGKAIVSGEQPSKAHGRRWQWTSSPA